MGTIKDSGRNIMVHQIGFKIADINGIFSCLVRNGYCMPKSKPEVLDQILPDNFALWEEWDYAKDLGITNV